MAWIQIMPGVYAGVPGEAQLKVAVKVEAETTGDQPPGDWSTCQIEWPVDWWEFEALEHDASELA